MVLIPNKDPYSSNFQSFEMNNIEQQHRHDAMRSHIAHSRLIRGALTKEEEARYQKVLEDMEGMHKFYLTDAVSAMTVTGLAAKIDKLRPDSVFVDGVYLMVDEITGEQNSPQALTNITRGLKQLAMSK